ncbi:unnamed protein product [Bursaphelenchus okinawaensis]|uniref:Uncharacterized protein n=1 Tax=Bursaphelenchus okinawaensis TaxID=465554 RepID=A0A811KSR3_9BILA|nr:unnamed protein product [Bursaphelenchus okinawaensis]CAG9110228.1 unnamed protein product [Bursaphelenchus okinawaensis]
MDSASSEAPNGPNLDVQQPSSSTKSNANPPEMPAKDVTSISGHSESHEDDVVIVEASKDKETNPQVEDNVIIVGGAMETVAPWDPALRSSVPASTPSRVIPRRLPLLSSVKSSTTNESPLVRVGNNLPAMIPRLRGNYFTKPQHPPSFGLAGLSPNHGQPEIEEIPPDPKAKGKKVFRGPHGLSFALRKNDPTPPVAKLPLYIRGVAGRPAPDGTPGTSGVEKTGALGTNDGSIASKYTSVVINTGADPKTTTGPSGTKPVKSTISPKKPKNTLSSYVKASTSDGAADTSSSKNTPGTTSSKHTSGTNALNYTSGSTLPKTIYTSPHNRPSPTKKPAEQVRNKEPEADNVVDLSGFDDHMDDYNSSQSDSFSLPKSISVGHKTPAATNGFDKSRVFQVRMPEPLNIRFSEDEAAILDKFTAKPEPSRNYTEHINDIQEHQTALEYCSRLIDYQHAVIKELHDKVIEFKKHGDEWKNDAKRMARQLSCRVLKPQVVKYKTPYSKVSRKKKVRAKLRQMVKDTFEYEDEDLNKLLRDTFPEAFYAADSQEKSWQKKDDDEDGDEDYLPEHVYMPHNAPQHESLYY